MRGCLVSYFITKPQLGISTMTCPLRCLVSYFITKPQRSAVSAHSRSVV